MVSPSVSCFLRLVMRHIRDTIQLACFSRTCKENVYVDHGRSFCFSGNTKLVRVKVLIWETTCGYQGLYCIVLLKTLESKLLLTPNLSQGTGMALAPTQTTGK